MIVDVLYVSPLSYGSNASVDAMCHSLDTTLAGAGMQLRIAYADFRDPGWPARTERLIASAVRSGVAAIVLYTIDPARPAEAVREAVERGVPVVTFERPRFPVSASVVCPNFNQGRYMAEYLADLLSAGSRVAVVGGPGTPDDDELVLGIRHGLVSSGLVVVNDTRDERYCNATDDRSGGRTATANLLADFPDLDGLVPYNDESARGAIEALAGTGRQGTVRIVSRNGTPDAVQRVRQGIQDGTWDLDTIGIGRTAGELLVRLVVGRERLDGLCVASPVGAMITPATVESWRPWEQRVRFRELRPWFDDG